MGDEEDWGVVELEAEDDAWGAEDPADPADDWSPTAADDDEPVPKASKKKKPLTEKEKAAEFLKRLGYDDLSVKEALAATKDDIKKAEAWLKAHDRKPFFQSKDAFAGFVESTPLGPEANPDEYYMIFAETCRNLKGLAKAVGISETSSILNQFYKEFVEEAIIESKEASPVPSKRCLVCLNDFDDSGTKVVKIRNCEHQMICKDCFKEFVSRKISSLDVMPWLRCPAEEFGVFLHSKDIASSGITPTEILQFLRENTIRNLVRCDFFFECKSKECIFGFLCEDDSPRTEICEICGVSQTLSRKDRAKAKMNEEFKELIDSGLMRPCPKCDHLAMREKGLCNIMECVKCGIWWNWKTRATGSSSRELKEKARLEGSLWEPGELEWQRELERTNPAEFRRFLERNGIKYDPTYMRGS